MGFWLPVVCTAGCGTVGLPGRREWGEEGAVKISVLTTPFFGY